MKKNLLMIAALFGMGFGAIGAVRAQGVMQVYVKHMTGDAVSVQVDPPYTVAGLKSKIQEKQGIAPEKQRLIFAGKELQDGKSLSDYSVQKDSTIHLVLKLR